MALTTIASFREAHAAHIARARLEAEGIPAFVADEYLAGVQWFYADAIGGVKIQVPLAYADQAREVVRADHSADLRRVARPRRRTPLPEACPACGSRRVERTPRSRAAGGDATRLPLVVWTNRLECRACGAAW